MDVDASFLAHVSARWSTLYRLAVLLAGPANADNVTQAALLRCYLSWRTVQQADSPEVQVEQVLVNTAVTEGRRRLRAATSNVDWSDQYAVDAHEESAEDREVLWARISRLPPRQRAVVVLRCYEDLFDAEIARTLGCARITVKAETAAALESLEVTLQMTGDLRAELELRADETAVPMAPIGLLLARGRQARRARARRRTTLSAAVVTVVAATAFVSSLGGSSPTDQPASPVGSRAHGLPGAVPNTFDLPRGAPPERAYVTGRTLHLASGEVTLESGPGAVLQAGSSVIVQYRSSKIVRVDAVSRDVEVLADTAAGRPVVDPGGRYVAWQAAGDGQARVVLRTLQGTSAVDTQTFPATPACCDNPFVVQGITRSGRLFASLPAGNKTWAWDIPVPGGLRGPVSSGGVHEVRGLAGGFIAQVVANEVVVQHLHNRVFGVGTVTDDTFTESERIEARIANFADPSGRRVVYSNHDGDVHVRDRRPARNAIFSDVVLRLPELAEVPRIYWEDAEHVLLDASNEGGAGWLLRCDLRTGRCETAFRFDGSHRVAGS